MLWNDVIECKISDQGESSWNKVAPLGRGNSPKGARNWELSLGSTSSSWENKSFISEGGSVWHTMYGIKPMLVLWAFTLSDDFNTPNPPRYVHNDFQPFLLLVFAGSSVQSTRITESCLLSAQSSDTPHLEEFPESSPWKRCWLRSCPEYLSDTNTHVSKRATK